MANQSSIHMPWSGPVNQALDFMNSWFRTIGSQFGLVNITVGSSADPDAEKRVLEDVGSYGRQLGRIGDALRVLVEQTNISGLTHEQRKALVAFTYQVDKVDEIKAKYR